MDTIGLIFRKEFAPNIDLLKEIPQYLTRVNTEGLSYGIETINGKLGSFDITVTPEKVRIRNASLQKFLTGNNLSPFGRSGIEKAFEKLGDTLHLPIFKAEVTNFDFAKNVKLKNDVSLYLHYLGNCGNYRRCLQPNGINYIQVNKKFCIYDKIKELKHHREAIPPIYANSCLMRLESRYTGKLSSHFNLPNITPATLIDEDFYILVNNELLKTYLRIDKQKTFKIDMQQVTTKSQFKLLGVLALVQMEGGKMQSLENIKERYKKGELTGKQAHDLRDLIEQSSEMKLQNIESDLITELNEAVRQSIHNYR